MCVTTLNYFTFFLYETEGREYSFITIFYVNERIRGRFLSKIKILEFNLQRDKLDDV